MRRRTRLRKLARQTEGVSGPVCAAVTLPPSAASAELKRLQAALVEELQRTALPNSLAADPAVLLDAQQYGVAQTMACLVRTRMTVSELRERLL
ncbi:hypothetical protein [uncultured Deinococcus sp.]|uniref:hypothetical protein n=1 Tax=uncultured Deinococcus sp. TaxID=158789 RepID=UPI0025D5FD82|nr:hypothetical protein [uncultured Deinococcus sp.]